MFFVLDIDPKTVSTAQQKQYTVRNGRAIVYAKKAVKDTRKRLRAALEAYVPDTLVAQAYKVDICFYYRLSTFVHTEKGTPKNTRPDLDNLVKLLLDVISESGIAWADDAAVTDLHLRKLCNVHGVPPCITVDIEADTL